MRGRSLSHFSRCLDGKEERGDFRRHVCSVGIVAQGTREEVQHHSSSMLWRMRQDMAATEARFAEQLAASCEEAARSAALQEVIMQRLADQLATQEERLDHFGHHVAGVDTVVQGMASEWRQKLQSVRSQEATAAARRVVGERMRDFNTELEEKMQQSLANLQAEHSRVEDAVVALQGTLAGCEEVICPSAAAAGRSLSGLLAQVLERLAYLEEASWLVPFEERRAPSTRRGSDLSMTKDEAPPTGAAAAAGAVDQLASLLVGESCSLRPLVEASFSRKRNPRVLKSRLWAASESCDNQPGGRGGAGGPQRPRWHSGAGG